MNFLKDLQASDVNSAPYFHHRHLKRRKRLQADGNGALKLFRIGASRYTHAFQAA